MDQALRRLRTRLSEKPLEQLRALLLSLDLFIGLLLLLRIGLASDAGRALQATGWAGMLCLAAWLVRGFRSGFPLWALPLEGVCVIGASLPLGGPLAMLPTMALLLGYRSLFRRGWRGLAPTAAYGLAAILGTILASLLAIPPDPLFYRLLQIPGMVAVGVIMWLLGEALHKQEDAFARQRLLTQAGQELVAAATRDDIMAAGLRSARLLLGGRGVRSLPPVGDFGREAAIAVPLTSHTGSQGRLALEGREPVPVEVEQALEALCTLIALRLEADEESQAGRRQADLRAEHLAELNRFKDELLNSVSYELRSPLTSIRAYSELLLTYQDAEVQREFLDIINFESERLARLVSDVLDLTRIQSGSFVWHMAPVDVPALLHDAARIYRPLIAREGLEFDVGAEERLPSVEGDRERLLQVICNLLHNALKFTARGSVGLAAYHAGREVHVAVSDTGFGVAPADRDRIFDKFQQSGGPAGKVPGTGLGLTICRHIVERHGGRIWVSPGARGGSVFTFALPAQPIGEEPRPRDVERPYSQVPGEPIASSSR